MSRPLRIEIEDGIYHVTARGWERRVIVRDDPDDPRHRLFARCLGILHGIREGK